jgi:tetratricopeptide (TPR) repeat protein
LVRHLPRRIGMALAMALWVPAIQGLAMEVLLGPAESVRLWRDAGAIEQGLELIQRGAGTDAVGSLVACIVRAGTRAEASRHPRSWVWQAEILDGPQRGCRGVISPRDFTLEAERAAQPLARAAEGTQTGRVGAREPAQTVDAALVALRAEYARRFCEPAPHIALAKYYHERGNRLMAFGILEGARLRFSTFNPERGSFHWGPGPGGQQSFEQTFDTVFRGRKPFDNSPAAEAALLQKLKTRGDSLDVLWGLADIHISRRQYRQAEGYLKKLTALEPDNLDHAVTLSRVLDEAGRPEDEVGRPMEDFARRHPGSEQDYAFRIERLARLDKGAARKLVEEALDKFPGVGLFHGQIAMFLHGEGRIDEAERALVKAAALAPEKPQVQSAVGKFFLRERRDPPTALRYYLDAYFLDPHFYDGEFAEYRIKRLNRDVTKAVFADRRKAGTTIEELLSSEDSRVVALAVEEARKAWRPSYRTLLLSLLDHDDEGLRAGTAGVLAETADPSFQRVVDELLKDPDHRKRGLAAYIAVRTRGPSAFPQLQGWLTEDSQLLRFDALSALIVHGGEAGRKIALDHRTREKHPYIRAMLDGLKDAPAKRSP